MPAFSTLFAALDTYWYVVVAIAVFLLSCWRALPLATRDAIEQRFPRLVGAVRVLYAILPDLVGAGRALRIQIVEGQPKRGSRPEVSDQPRRAGFGRVRLLRAISLGILLCTASAVLGCPMPPPDGCAPMATRCSPQGIPQTCSATQRWSAGATAEPCSAHGANVRCCWTRSPYGRDLHACVPESACLPEPPQHVTPVSAPPAPIASAAPSGAWREWLGLNGASKGGAQ
jgi:hypothetical protein